MRKEREIKPEWMDSIQTPGWTSYRQLLVPLLFVLSLFLLIYTLIK